jgi:type I restriction enzyme S subunit
VSEDVKQPESQALQEYELPNGWTRTRLGKVIQPSKDKVDPEVLQERPYVGLEHIEKDTGNLLDHGYSEDVTSTKAAFRKGDLLYGRLRPYLNKVYVADFVGICSTDILVFPENPYVSNRFLLYRMLSPDFVRYANLRASGVQHPRVHYKNLAKFPLALPPLPEQRRIVKAIETQFTRLDAAVTALERAQANLARYRASVLQAAVEGCLVPTEANLAREEGRDYEPADALLERILEARRARWEEERWQYEIERAKKKAAQAERKAAGLPYYIRQLPEASWIDRTEEEYAPYLPKTDRWKQKYDEPEPPDTEDLLELPEGWIWTSMEQLGEILGGLTKNSKRKRYPLRMPYLRVANVYADELRLDEIKQIGVKESELDRVLLEKNDLLIVEGNGSIDQIGRVAIWDDSITPCVHQNHLIKVRLVLQQMAKYVLHWLLSIGGREQIIDVASSTSGLYTLSLSKVSRLPVPLPPLAEQHRIVEEVERRLSVVEALEEAVEANLTRAERLRQAILKTAFEGRLVPQNPDDEPASALMTRIKARKQVKKTPQQGRLL